MKILIAISLVIVFISAFFILLTGDALFRSSFECSYLNGHETCVYIGIPPSGMVAVFIILLFFLIDTVTVYLLINTIRNAM